MKQSARNNNVKRHGGATHGVFSRGGNRPQQQQLEADAVADAPDSTSGA